MESVYIFFKWLYGKDTLIKEQMCALTIPVKNWGVFCGTGTSWQVRVTGYGYHWWQPLSPRKILQNRKLNYSLSGTMWYKRQHFNVKLICTKAWGAVQIYIYFTAWSDFRDCWTTFRENVVWWSSDKLSSTFLAQWTLQISSSWRRWHCTDQRDRLLLRSSDQEMDALEQDVVTLSKAHQHSQLDSKVVE